MSRRSARPSKAWAACLVPALARVALANPDTEGDVLVDRFDPRSGLPGLTVTALAQTADGQLWIGMPGRLARYDGHAFVAVDTPVAIGSRSEIAALFAEGGAVWAATMREGLLHLARDGASVFDREDGLPVSNVAAVCRDRAGVLWAGTTDGPARLQGDRFFAVTGRERMAWHRRGVNALLCHPAGVLVGPIGGPPWWIAEAQDVPQPPLPADVEVFALAAGGDGAIYLGGIEGGLLRVARDGRHERVSGLPQVRVTAMVEDREGVLWVGTQGAGLYRSARGQPLALRPVLEHALPAQNVTALLEGLDGTLWVGTAAGLVHVRPRPFVQVAVPPAFGGSPPRALAVARDGTLWLGSDGAGLARHPPLQPGAGPRADRWQVFGAAHGLPSPRVFTVAETAGGELVVGTNLGAARWSGQRFEPLPRAHALPLNEVRALHPATDGTLWMGIGGVGVVRRDRDGTQQHLGAEAGLTASYVTAFAQDETGALWVGGDGGLFRARGDRFERVPLAFEHEEVTAVLPRHDGSLLVAGEHGLQVLRRGGRAPAQPVALAVGSVTGMLLHGADLWLMGGDGLIRLDRAALDAFLEARGGRPAITRFTVHDGLRDADFRPPASPRAAVLPDGRLLLSSATEVLLSPVRWPPPPRVFSPRILSLTVDDQAHALGAPALLRARPGRVRFDFTAACFGGPPLRFATVLRGDDDAAGDIAQTSAERSVTFARLSGGRYRFSVAVLAPGGETPLGPPATFEFTVARAWHEHRWVVGLVTVAAVGILSFGAAALRSWQLARRFALLTRERDRIATDLHDGTEQNLAGMLLQLAVAERALTPEHPARGAIAAVKAIVGQVHSDLRQQIWQLRSRAGHAELAAAVGEVLGRARHAGLEASAEGASGLRLPATHEAVILRVLEECLTNTLKYASATRFSVRFLAGQGRLRVCIEDDGCGFDPGLLAETSVAHLGLAGMRERTRRVGGRLSIESAPGQGTRVEVELPRDAPTWPRGEANGKAGS